MKDDTRLLSLSSEDFSRIVLSDDVIGKTLSHFRDWKQTGNPDWNSAALLLELEEKDEEEEEEEEEGVPPEGGGTQEMAGAEWDRVRGAAVAAARESLPAGGDAQAVLGWGKLLVSETLRLAGGSARLDQLDAVAKESAGGLGLDIDRVLRLLKRDRQVAYDAGAWQDRTAVTVTWIAV